MNYFARMKNDDLVPWYEAIELILSLIKYGPDQLAIINLICYK